MIEEVCAECGGLENELCFYCQHFVHGYKPDNAAHQMCCWHEFEADNGDLGEESYEEHTEIY